MLLFILITLIVVTAVAMCLERICNKLDLQGESRVRMAYWVCDTRKCLSYNKHRAMPLQGRMVASFLRWYIVRRNKWELL